MTEVGKQKTTSERGCGRQGPWLVSSGGGQETLGQDGQEVVALYVWRWDAKVFRFTDGQLRIRKCISYIDRIWDPAERQSSDYIKMFFLLIIIDAWFIACECTFVSLLNLKVKILCRHRVLAFLISMSLTKLLL